MHNPTGRPLNADLLEVVGETIGGLLDLRVAQRARRADHSDPIRVKAGLLRKALVHGQRSRDHGARGCARQQPLTLALFEQSQSRDRQGGV